MEDFAREMLAPARKPSHYAPLVVAGADRVWAADLADMQEWAKDNEGYRYILVVVDVFSRFAWVQPLKGKTAAETLTAFKEIIAQAGRKPDKVLCDEGGEFARIKDLGITRYSVYGQSKAAPAEAFIKTLKHAIWFRFLKTQSRKWVDVLSEIVDGYNHRAHSSTGMTPDSARKPSKERHIWDKLYAEQPPVGKPRYSLGQWVRISRIKGKFEKGFHPSWSAAVYQVIGIDRNMPILYTVQDYYGEPITGRFYESELKAVKDPDVFLAEAVLQRKKQKGVDMALVKWMGYDKPSWVPASTLTSLHNP